MHSLRVKYKIPYVDLNRKAQPVRSRGPYVFLLKDLDEFILTRRVGEKAWNKHSKQLPATVARRLLRLSWPGLQVARRLWGLGDYSEASIRKYLAKQVVNRAVKVVRKAILETYPDAAKEWKLETEMERIRQILLADPLL